MRSRANTFKAGSASNSASNSPRTAVTSLSSLGEEENYGSPRRRSGSASDSDRSELASDISQSTTSTLSAAHFNRPAAAFSQTSKLRRQITTTTIWRLPKASGRTPIARWGHAAAVVDTGKTRYLYIMGGWEGEQSLGDVYRFDIEKLEWERCDTKGKQPSPRVGHTMTVVDNSKLIVIGGGNGDNYLSDINILQLATMEWIQPKITSNKKVYIQDDLLVSDSHIPNSGAQEHQPEKELLQLQQQQLQLQQQQPQQQVGEDEEVLMGSHTAEIADTGFGTPAEETRLNNSIVHVKTKFPAPRFRHTAVMISNNQVLMFGGSGNSKIYGDLWILDTNKMEWSEPEASGQKPSPRLGHSATVCNSKMYIFGGVVDSRMLNEMYELDLITFEWKQIDLPKSGPIPAPRAAHTADYVEGKYFAILWGGDDNRILDDLFVWDLKKNVGKRMTFKNPLPRSSHTANIIDGNNLYVFGGGDGVTRYKELYVLDLKLAIEKSGIEEITPAVRKVRAASTITRNMPPAPRVVKSSADIALMAESASTAEATSSAQPSIPSQSQQAPVEQVKQTNKPEHFIDVRSEIVIDDALDHKPETQAMINRRRRASTRVEMYHPKDAKEITNWLVSLGLGKYAILFVNEEVDLDCMPLITETDLIRLGITKLGPRKKILAAARKLPNQFGSASDEQQPDKRSPTQPMTAETLFQATHSFHTIADNVSALSVTCEQLKESVKAVNMSLSMVAASLAQRHPMVPQVPVQFARSQPFQPGSPPVHYQEHSPSHPPPAPIPPPPPPVTSSPVSSPVTIPAKKKPTAISKPISKRLSSLDDVEGKSWFIQTENGETIDDLETPK